MSAPWRRVGDKASLYVPVLLMALLALGTWWLVRNAPKPIVSGPQKEVPHEPDYFLKDFVIKNFEASGRIKSRLAGTLGQHYPDTDTLEIDQARMLSFTREPVAATATQKALPVMRLESDFLQVWPNDERVSTNKPVVMTRGEDRFTGDSMQYTHLDQILQMQGRVKGVIQPSKPR